MFERAAPEILTPFVREALPHAYARLAHTLGDLESLQAPAARPGGESTAILRHGAVAG